MTKKYIVGIDKPHKELFEFKTKKDSEEFIKDVKKEFKDVQIITAIRDDHKGEDE